MVAAQGNAAPEIEASATEAVERVLDAGQRLVTEGIDLARLDAQVALTERLGRGARIVIPALFAFGGWWILMAAVTALLNDYVTTASSLGIVGGAHVLVGGGLAVAAARRARAASRTDISGARPGARQ